MGDAVLADPQAQEQLPVAGIHSEAFNETLDMDTFERGVAPRQFEFPNHVPSISMDDYIPIIDAWTARQRQVKFPRSEQRYHSDEDPWSRNANSQGQTSLAAGVWQNASGAPNIASHHEMTPGRSLSQGELACRAAVAGSQTPGVAVNGVTLRLPHLKLPSDDHDTTASGSHPRKILNEVSAGANLMVTRKAASSICCGI
jgi:hypothetical protein